MSDVNQEFDLEHQEGPHTVKGKGYYSPEDEGFIGKIMTNLKFIGSCFADTRAQLEKIEFPAFVKEALHVIELAFGKSALREFYKSKDQDFKPDEKPGGNGPEDQDTPKNQ